MAQIEYIERLLADLARLRSQAVETLYVTVRDLPKDLRDKALALKRECFNGRPLAGKEQNEWEGLPLEIQDLLANIAGLEAEIGISMRNLESIYEEERRSSRAALQDCLSIGSVDRGIALAGTELLDAFHRIAIDHARHDRKTKRIERSMLRYISRASTKLSPFSTLTRIALGVAGDEPALGPPQFSGRLPWRESSLVRAKRYIVEQCREVLFMYPGIREHLFVSINSTAVEREPGFFEFLRPAGLLADRQSMRLRYSQPSRVKVRLQGPLIDWINTNLLGKPATYHEFLSALEEEFCATEGESGGDSRKQRIQDVVERFLEVGFLVLNSPWATHAPHQERCLLYFLESLPKEAVTEVTSVIDTLSEIVRIEAGYRCAELPAKSVRKINALTEELFQRIRDAFPGYTMHFDVASQNFYEDVFVQAPKSSSVSCGEIVQLNRDTAQELLAVGSLVWSIRGLYEHRHDVHYSLFKVFEDLGAGRTEVPFLEYFERAEPIWQRYVAHCASGATDSFNPFGLRAIEELNELRREIRSQLTASLEYSEESGNLNLPLESLRHLEGLIPSHLKPPVGPCLFVQAADSEGKLWVANRFFEGNGRLSSRFGVVMDDAAREWYVQHFTERSHVRFKGEDCEIVDALYTRSNTVNSHWPQTRRVIEIPGEYSGLPQDRVLSLRDLVVRREDLHPEVSLRDCEGHRLIPVFLSAVQEPYIPTLVKFLTFLGANPRVYFDIETPIRRNGTVGEVDRLVVGRLVVRRKRWLVEPSALPDFASSDYGSFLDINLWRRSVGLPDEVFVIEPVRASVEESRSYKPQYVDFRSPLFVEIFKTIVEGCSERVLTIEEALPVPGAFPVGPGGFPIGVELILESLAFAPARLDEEHGWCSRGHCPRDSP